MKWRAVAATSSLLLYAGWCVAQVDPLPTLLRPAATAQTPATTTTPAPVPAPQAPPPPPLASKLDPFGASLFAGTSSGASITPNPNYVIQTGDTVSIRTWGGVTVESTGAVDTQGNVFLPGYGPVHVAGVRAEDLQSTVQQQVASSFTTSVRVYAVLQSARQVGVFVTGFVRAPGRYLGAASESALDYLQRAGGVDPARGSYRNITLQRGGQTIADIDLYKFLLSGMVPPVNLREGDAIVVARQYPMISASGAVRNNYLFEMPDATTAGKEISELARPLPAATDVFLRGTRSGRPYAAYLKLDELPGQPLNDQDELSFVTDAPATTVSVQIQGSRIGPSVIVAQRDSSLAELLDHVAVNPQLADTRSVYVLRPGLAQMQGRALQDALDRLEKSLFYAVSTTTGEAQIRASEAQLIASYIDRARQIQPEGRLVVVDDDGHLQDVRPLDNDVVVIPEKSQTIMVVGEVAAPQAIVFDPALTPADYVLRAGGLTERGRLGRKMIRRASGLLLVDSDAPLRPGDELIILPFIDSKNFQLVKDFIQVVYEAAGVGYFSTKF